MKILFVDDEPNVLRALRRLFMDEDNYELLMAESGADGLQVLEQEQGVCVVVSDYRMPGMNGVEFLSQVHDQWPKTVRIVLSGYADTASVVEAINIGHIYKFIPKPWNDDELRVDIANAVDTYFLSQNNEILSYEVAQRNLELKEINTNLERMVQERTSALEMRSQVLQLAQDVLDSIPVVVIGVDADDLIAQANDCANKLFTQQGTLLGERVSKVFPAGVLAFLEQVKLVGESTDIVHYNDRVFAATGKYLNNNLSRGMVITLIQKTGD
ncbi:MAG: response regulator [Desulfuromonas sp.]|nr:response regulator [Desulfuromonas sp.]